MRKICFAFLLSTLLLPMSLWAQEVFIRGKNQAATQARIDLEKLTRYKSSLDATHAVLIVDEESWSPDFLSPATVAVTMKLISPTGELLWSKTESVGSRPQKEVVQGLLKDLAKANPPTRAEAAIPTAAGPAGRNK
jgi:hypothetical protein